jgi:hypothetical protein
MEDITQQLQQLIKLRKNTKLIYKQTKLKRASFFVDDSSDK